MFFDKSNACMTQKVDEYGPYDAYCVLTKLHEGAHLYVTGQEIEDYIVRIRRKEEKKEEKKELKLLSSFKVGGSLVELYMKETRV